MEGDDRDIEGSNLGVFRLARDLRNTMGREERASRAAWRALSRSPWRTEGKREREPVRLGATET